MLGTRVFDEIIPFENISMFTAHILKSDGVRTCIIVYNSDTEQVRDVHIKPDRYWGGPGMIGCDILQGIFHVLPPRKKNMWAVG